MLICLFLILKCIYTSATTINNGLLRIQDMEYQCKMLLNPGQTTQA